MKPRIIILWRKGSMAKAKAVESKKFHFNKEDGMRVLKGLGIAMVGAGLTYITNVVTGSDFKIVTETTVIDLTPFVVAGWSIVANIVRVWLQGK